MVRKAWFLPLFIVGMIYGATNIHGAPEPIELRPSILPCLIDVSDTSVVLDMEATAYTAGPESTGKTPGHPAYGITKSGTTVHEGRTIAVDPELIPLRTTVEVWYEGSKMGDYVAEDTGRLIKGCIIDIFVKDLDRALEWGRRQVEVRVPIGAVSK